MCMTCGCGDPNASHDDPDHITYDQLQRAASAAGIDVESAADNLHALARQIRDEGMPTG
jgi:hypothetical protein